MLTSVNTFFFLLRVQGVGIFPVTMLYYSNENLWFPSLSLRQILGFGFGSRNKKGSHSVFLCR